MKVNIIFYVILVIFITFFISSLEIDVNELKTILESPTSQIDSVFNERTREILRGFKKIPKCNQRYFKKKCKIIAVTSSNTTTVVEKSLPGSPVPVWGILVPFIALFGSVGGLIGICIIGCCLLCCAALIIIGIIALVLFLRNRLQKKKTSFFNFYEKNKKINGLEDIKLMDTENTPDNNFEKQFEEDNYDTLSDEGLKKGEPPENNEFEEDKDMEISKEKDEKEMENEFEDDTKSIEKKEGIKEQDTVVEFESEDKYQKVEKLEDEKNFDFEEEMGERKEEKKIEEEKIEFEENKDMEISKEKDEKAMENEFESDTKLIEKKEVIKEEQEVVEFEQEDHYETVEKAPEIEEKMEFEEEN